MRRTFDAINRRDIDQALAVGDDDLVVDWSNSVGPAKGMYRGKEEIRRLWMSFAEAFDVLQWEPEEFIEIGEDRLIVVNRARVHGRGSGVATNAVGVQLWTIRGGKARRVKLYQSKAEALEAVGLRG